MSKRYLAIGLLLAAILTGVIFYIRSQKHADFSKADIAKIKGDLAAPIEIIEYSNFACDHCRDVRKFIAQLFQKYPGKIKIVFRHFPAYAEQSSLWAHVAAECAASKGLFWPYYDKLFDNQKEWQTSPQPFVHFIKYAKELGMNPDKFSECLSNELMIKKVREDDRSGLRLGFQTTPSFIIGGEFFVGQRQFEARAEMKIESELRKK
ncbi:MAG: thioredoxin domain-containing protein [Candidatus Omnitrophica bacterium]|nr:thioredoxin domain-containing protein [Candidatus Omnitrophota bacterium]